MKLCYLCDSPVEYSAIGISVVIDCNTSGPDDSEIICSNCTRILQEAKKHIRRAGIVLIKKVDGVLNIEDIAKYIKLNQ